MGDIKVKLSVVILAAGFMIATGMPARADDAIESGVLTMFSTRGDALQAIEADREGVIVELATVLTERDFSRYIQELRQLENHELIDLSLGVTSLGTRATEGVTGYENLTYTALPAPCRILDTRKYSGTPIPINGGQAREVFSTNIDDQGGNALCATPLLGKAALVVVLSAVSPTFPSKFTSNAYGTLLSGAELTNGWSYSTSLASGQKIYGYDDPPYKSAASIVWDEDTALITTLAVVSSQKADPNVVLYSNGTAHFTLDVVGYYDAAEF